MNCMKCLGMRRAIRGLGLAGGFTLLELMVTVAVVAILAAVATPSLVSVVNSNRLATQANELVASLQIARSEAIRLNNTVTLCRSTDGASCAAAGPWTRWIVISGTEVLRDSSLRPPIQITSVDAAVNFRSDGRARTPAGALSSNVFTVCIPTTYPPQNRRVVDLALGSRVATNPGGSGDGTCP